MFYHGRRMISHLIDEASRFTVGYDLVSTHDMTAMVNALIDSIDAHLLSNLWCNESSCR